MREENDVQLAGLMRDVQRLAGDIDKTARERGVRGIADLMANIQAQAREAEWRCNDLLPRRNAWLKIQSILKVGG